MLDIHPADAGNCAIALRARKKPGKYAVWIAFFDGEEGG